MSVIIDGDRLFVRVPTIEPIDVPTPSMTGNPRPPATSTNARMTMPGQTDQPRAMKRVEPDQPRATTAEPWRVTLRRTTGDNHRDTIHVVMARGRDDAVRLLAETTRTDVDQLNVVDVSPVIAS